MKKIVLSAGVLAISVLGFAACTIDAGIGGAGGGACEAISCAEALSQGLQVQGDALCDPASDSTYGDLFSCACDGASPCADVCGPNLCVDDGMDGACADCIGQTCGSANAACSAN